MTEMPTRDRSMGQLIAALVENARWIKAEIERLNGIKIETIMTLTKAQLTDDERGQLIFELVKDMHEAADEIERLRAVVGQNILLQEPQTD